MKIFKRSSAMASVFCERCGEVCSRECRRAAQVERAQMDALLMGMRVA
jgi:hypothetical protein